jgi:hypothetical protein
VTTIEPYFSEVTVKAIDLDDPLILEEDAAAILHMSKWTMMRLRKERKIQYVVILRKYLYRRSFLVAFIEKCTVQPRSR